MTVRTIEPDVEAQIVARVIGDIHLADRIMRQLGDKFDCWSDLGGLRAALVVSLGEERRNASCGGRAFRSEDGDE